MKKAMLLVAAAVLLFSTTFAVAQDGGYFANWFQRVDKTKSEQPHWITPVATVTPLLEEEVRYDQFWQTNNAGITTNNFGGGKGVELIPFRHVELIVGVPPYLAHNNPALQDGFGDESFLLKYRLLSAGEHQGNYVLTAFLGASIPTGSHNNGALDAVITPTIAYGKGFGPFDAQGTFGVAMPTGDTALIGRKFLWNNAIQYRLFKKFWPEVEVNSSFIQNGPDDGRKQTFLTPGLVIGRLPLFGRAGLTFGGGFQIAATHYHATNHNGILTVRIPF